MSCRSLLREADPPVAPRRSPERTRRPSPRTASGLHPSCSRKNTSRQSFLRDFRLFFKHTASAPLKVPPSAAAVRTRALVTLDVKTPFPSPDRRRQRADLVRQIGNRIQCYHQGWPRIYPRGIECIITAGQSANPRTSRISKSYSAVLVLSIMTHR